MMLHFTAIDGVTIELEEGEVTLGVVEEEGEIRGRDGGEVEGEEVLIVAMKESEKVELTSQVSMERGSGD
jgi:hypothetical protein